MVGQRMILGFPTGRDSETFQDSGTGKTFLSRDKGTTGQAQNLATGRDGPGFFETVPSRPGTSRGTKWPSFFHIIAQFRPKGDSKWPTDWPKMMQKGFQKEFRNEFQKGIQNGIQNDLPTDQKGCKKGPKMGSKMTYWLTHSLYSS